MITYLRACCWRAISSGKPRSTTRYRDAVDRSSKAPDHVWAQFSKLAMRVRFPSPAPSSKALGPHASGPARRRLRFVTSSVEVRGSRASLPARADDSGDGNADDNRAPAAHCETGSRRRSAAGREGCVLLGVTCASALVVTQGTGLPPRDRSFDRNEQHHGALAHHPANTAWPRRAVRSGTCLHLLIAGFLVRVQIGEQSPREGRSP